MKNKYTDSEEKIQADCFFWLRNTYRFTYGLCFHIPNGKRRTPREAQTLKNMGVVAGIPDLFLSIPNRGFNGFYIEMKTPKGKESAEQLIIHSRLREVGYKVATCISLDEFKNEILDYLRDSDYI